MNATMSLEKTKHYPVMLNQILSITSPQLGGTFIDCTFGGGSYSKEILKFSNTKVIAIDREKFSKINEIININFNPRVIIFDLGLSSFQLADKKRGFSFNSQSFLNMEMGINKYSAYDVINTLDKKYLANIIKVLGEEKDGKIIANKIAKYRNIKPIKTSYELAKIITEAKKNFKNYKKNPATKTFQAIRIFVNRELTELMRGLVEATKLLSNDGILVVVSFHSLEDKIVKNFFNLYSNLRKNPSRYLPMKDNEVSLFKSTSKKPLVPNIKELEENKSSRSAKLRYAIRNNNSFFQPSEFENKFENYFELEGFKL